MDSTAKIEIHIGFATDQGRQREMNEDSYCVFVPYPGSEDESDFQAVLGVADGMGGHKAGDAASRMITEDLTRSFIQGEYKQRHAPDADWLQVMKSELAAAHHRLHEMSRSNPDMKEAGSTLTFGIFREGILYLAHVGDSRCYRIRENNITRLTQDHSWVAERVSSGLLSEEEARNHPKNNVLTQAVGFDEVIRPQLRQEIVVVGDKYLFCSDGLTNMLEENEIRDIILRNSHPQRACDRLVEMANIRGGLDNITVLLGAVDPPLPVTREAEIENPTIELLAEKPTGKWRRIVLIGALAVALAGGGFLAGVGYRGCRASRELDRSVSECAHLIEEGLLDQAAERLRLVLELSPGHKKALELKKKLDRE